MSWRELIEEKKTIIAPWVGMRNIRYSKRLWRIYGDLPDEFGWHKFEVDSANKATWEGSASEEEVPVGWEDDYPQMTGYMVENRFIPDNVNGNVGEGFDFRCVGHHVELVPRDFERFTRARVARYENSMYVFVSSPYGLGPELDVEDAFLERKDSLSDIVGVTPSLRLAFLFENYLRERSEERLRMREARRLEVEHRNRLAAQREALMREGASGEGRRALAEVDFPAAAKAALAVSGATYLDSRPDGRRGAMAVKFRLNGRRFECVVDAKTLNVVEAGLCLEDERTGEKGDTYFTLESIPGVYSEAIEQGVLVLYRRV